MSAISDRRHELEGLIEAARARFRAVHHRPAPPRIAVSPGRINLIGEHTDYNHGFVLPMAIDLYIAVAFAANDRGVLAAHSIELQETVEVPLGDLTAPGGADWYDYIAGVVWAFEDEGYEVPGLDIVVTGNIPIGAGLSSSAALEVATARSVAAAAGIPWNAEHMAKTAQRAENAYVGVPCGIMDPLAVASCEEGCALLIDCRSLRTSAHTISHETHIVVMDTGTRRALADGAYRERRLSCERAVSVLKSHDSSVEALRDVRLELLERAGEDLDAVTRQRARHVVTENQRTLDMAEALDRGDFRRAGALMNESHRSLRDDYGVSSRELDLLTEIACGHPACWGARMTGAGFGGCGIALVRSDRSDAFVSEVESAYREKTQLPGVLRVCRPVAGARLV